MNIEYKINAASEFQIQSLLLNCDRYFIPNLSSKVDITDYSKKIFDKSIRFEAWNDNNLVGLIATYINEKDSLSFITNVSVEIKFTNSGIASNLLKNCIEHVKDKNISKIELEVSENNISALNLYTKFNFEIQKNENSLLFMSLQLN